MRLAAFALGATLAAPASGQPVWFGPVPDSYPALTAVSPDYQQLFQPGAPWSAALADTRVFQVDRWDIESHDDATVARTVAFLRQHGIKLAVVYGVVPARNCGLEGTAHRPDENTLVSRKLKRAGGQADYLVVDEPLLWGHLATKPGACRYPIPELAAGYADEVRKIRTVFPNATLIDTETSSEITPGMLSQWLDAVSAALGEGGPKAVSFDVQWYRPWQQTVPPLLAVVQAHGIGYGVIFKGTYQDTTDEAYIAAAKQHAQQWATTIRAKPMFVLFQSWEQHPKRVLPEASDSTMTGLVKWYCDQREDHCR